MHYVNNHYDVRFSDVLHISIAYLVSLVELMDTPN